MSKKYRKLTPDLLRKIVLLEKKKMSESLEQGVEDIEKVDAEETPAKDLADSIEQDIDWMKALKIQERKIVRKLTEVRKAQRRVRAKLKKKL
jgi:hypothetical protein